MLYEIQSHEDDFAGEFVCFTYLIARSLNIIFQYQYHCQSLFTSIANLIVCTTAMARFNIKMSEAKLKTFHSFSTIPCVYTAECSDIA